MQQAPHGVAAMRTFAKALPILDLVYEFEIRNVARYADNEPAILTRDRFDGHWVNRSADGKRFERGWRGNQSRHCGVSAAGTDPNWLQRRRGQRQTAEESFVQKGVQAGMARRTSPLFRPSCCAIATSSHAVIDLSLTSSADPGDR